MRTAIRYPTGGSASWTNGPAGQLLRDEFFGVAVAATTGSIMVNTGASFEAKPVKVWNGSSWVTGKLKRYDGSTWQETAY